MSGPRAISGALVVDTNIVVSAVFGRRTAGLLVAASRFVRLVLSEDSMREAVRVVAHVARGGPSEPALLAAYLAELDPVSKADYQEHLPLAALTLRNAVATRNGSERDAHVLALAWSLDADIWSHDRDFAGTGWPSWSSANLLAALDQQAG